MKKENKEPCRCYRLNCELPTSILKLDTREVQDEGSTPKKKCPKFIQVAGQVLEVTWDLTKGIAWVCGKIAEKVFMNTIVLVLALVIVGGAEVYENVKKCFSGCCRSN